LNKSANVSFKIVISLLLSGLLILGASASTYVGSLSGYTTWTAANSPYYLTTNLVINSGDTLNIQPGVVVHLNGYQIQVYGLLNAQGTSSNKIYFLNDGSSNSQVVFKSSSSSSCIVDYGVFYSVPITVEGGSPRIADSYLTSTSTGALITVNSGVASIIGNTLSAQSSQDGVHINSGSAAISLNTITGAYCGIYNAAGASAAIASNSITYCFSGIYTAGSATIQQNTIIHNTNDGVVTQTSDVSILNNAIAYNKVGVSRDGNIQNNNIAHNTFGLWGQTNLSTIHNNNIVDSTTESVHLTEAGVNVDATNNWWGTTDETTIRQSISDFRFDHNLGNVTFTPYLPQPADAPVVPTSVTVPTPPPTPTSTPTPAPTATATPTATPYINPTYTPYPFETPISTPSLTPSQSVEPTDGPIFGGFSSTDVATAVVIVVVVCLVATIILVINRRFGHIENIQVNTKRRKRSL
jgi:hypothetical protein